MPQLPKKKTAKTAQTQTPDSQDCSISSVHQTWTLDCSISFVYLQRQMWTPNFPISLEKNHQRPNHPDCSVSFAYHQRRNLPDCSIVFVHRTWTPNFPILLANRRTIFWTRLQASEVMPGWAWRRYASLAEEDSRNSGCEHPTQHWAWKCRIKVHRESMAQPMY